jgi:CopG family nickel-responsive transcriptional regulator
MVDGTREIRAPAEWRARTEAAAAGVIKAAMKDQLVRFGVAMESSLLEELDLVVDERQCTRSELLRDLARAEVARSKVRSGVEAVATLTVVYDHHVRDLSEKLTELQHQLGERVRCTMHVHLSHDLCLEVIILRGRSDELRAVADRILATRGVKHGGTELIAVSGLPAAEDHHKPKTRKRRAPSPAA